MHLSHDSFEPIGHLLDVISDKYAAFDALNPLVVDSNLPDRPILPAGWKSHGS